MNMVRSVVLLGLVAGAVACNPVTPKSSLPITDLQGQKITGWPAGKTGTVQVSGRGNTLQTFPVDAQGNFGGTLEVPADSVLGSLAPTNPPSNCQSTIKSNNLQARGVAFNFAVVLSDQGGSMLNVGTGSVQDGLAVGEEWYNFMYSADDVHFTGTLTCQFPFQNDLVTEETYDMHIKKGWNILVARGTAVAPKSIKVMVFARQDRPQNTMWSTFGKLNAIQHQGHNNLFFSKVFPQ